MVLGQYNLARLQTLQPALRPIAQTFLEQCQAAGIPCEIIEGTRPFERQELLYSQGRTAPGSIVTYAKPGSSYHQYGLAFDIVPTAYKALPNWNPSGPLWARVGAIGKSLGLTWGGDFSTPDKPHFEFKAAPLSELLAYWQKFKTVMPITITPTTGGLAIIVMIAAAWYFFVRPNLSKTGLL